MSKTATPPPKPSTKKSGEKPTAQRATRSIRVDKPEKTAEDLINEFGKETEAHSPGTQAGDFAPEEETPGQPFTWEPEETTTPPPPPGATTPGPEVVNQEHFTPPPPPPPETVDEPPTVSVDPSKLLSPETSADLIIGVIDQIQTRLYTALNKFKVKKKMGSPEEFEHFMQQCQDISDGVKQFEELEISDRAKVRIAQRMLKRIDELPFTDEEWDKMQEALTLIIREMPEYQLPPSWGFTLAIAQAMIPRTLDLMID